ncbi:MAG: DnaA/Hda family protein, partial [Bdellovibrionales bacterium]
MTNGVVMKVQAPSLGLQEAKGNSETMFGHLRTSLRSRFGETAYRRWLEPMSFDLAQDASGASSVTLTLPTRFMRDWVDAHYGETIRSLLIEAVPGISVSFSVVSPLAKAAETKSAIDSAAALPITPLGRPIASPATTASSSFVGDLSADLDPRFTFDNFVVGKPNELAYAAARRVADTENPAFNPLFLYGGVGLGKTHLMHSIAWHIRKNYPHRRVLYMSA